MRKGKISILGNGVIDPWALLAEIEEIKNQGVEVTPENFMISGRHPLIAFLGNGRNQKMQQERKDRNNMKSIGPV